MKWTPSSPRAGKRPIRDYHDHFEVDCYGDFRLTPAIRPSVDLQIVPRQGFRVESYRDPGSGIEIPMIAAAVSEEILFDVFVDLLDTMSGTVDVVVESHHERRTPGDLSENYLREHIDLPVLQSYLHDFRDVILGDGCLGVAVVDPSGPSEVQFDDHKVLIVYSRKLRSFVEVFERYDIPRDNTLKLISEAEHLHSTRPNFQERVEALRVSLGAE